MMLETKNITHCENCGTQGAAWLEKFSALSVFECQICHGWSFQPKDPIDYKTLYSEDYFISGEYKNYPGEMKIHELNFSRIWKLVSKYIRQPCHLLEVGCAYGHFINFVQKRVESAIGLDVSSDAIKYAKANYGNRFIDLSRESFSNFSYNCLIAMFVWEHLEKPFQTLSQYVDKMESGGIFAITTVDSGAFVPKLRGKRWRQVHPPTHIHYPNRKSIELVCASMGMKILYQGNIGYYHSLHTYASAIGAGAITKKFPFIGRQPLLVNLLDTQIVIAKKI